MKIKCDNCGNEFEIGSRPDGLPNGIGYQLQDGTIYNICTDCVIKIGQEMALKRGDRDEMQNSDT